MKNIYRSVQLLSVLASFLVVHCAVGGAAWDAAYRVSTSAFAYAQRASVARYVIGAAAAKTAYSMLLKPAYATGMYAATNYPVFACALGVYALMRDDAKGLKFLKHQFERMGAVGVSIGRFLGAIDSFQDLTDPHVLLNYCKDGMYAYADRNRELLSAVVLPVVLWYGWKKLIVEMPGTIKVEGLEKEVDKLAIANWLINILPTDGKIERDLIGEQDWLCFALREQFVQDRFSSWGIMCDGDIHDTAYVDCLSESIVKHIDCEYSKLQALAEKISHYVPNGVWVVKEGRKKVGIHPNKTFDATEKQEEEFSAWLKKVKKDPYEAKSNKWLIIFKLIFKYKLPPKDIIWRIYNYYGRALQLYCDIDVKMRRLEKLRIIFNGSFKDWWRKNLITGVVIEYH